MFMLTEIWSMSIPNLVLEDVEIISSAHNPKSLLAALEFLIPKNAIKIFSVDINDKVLPWSDGDILNMIRILRSRHVGIKSLAFRHQRLHTRGPEEEKRLTFQCMDWIRWWLWNDFLARMTSGFCKSGGSCVVVFARFDDE
jgi:hypothetical protein